MESSYTYSSDEQRGPPSDPRHATRRVHQLPRADVMRSEVALQGSGLECGNAKSQRGDMVDNQTVSSSEPRLECLESLEVLENHLEASNCSKVDGQCWKCLKTFKGSRGLKVHLAKSKSCGPATLSSIGDRSSAPVQSGNPMSTVVPKPKVPDSSESSVPGESYDSQFNKRLHREEGEVRLPIRWPSMKENTKWDSFESRVISQLPSFDKSWTVRLEGLQRIVYSEAVESFGCRESGSKEKPKKNRRQIEIAAIRADIRSLGRALKSAPQTYKYALDQEMEERKRARNKLRRAENARKRRADRRKLRRKFYSNPFQAAKEMVSPRVEAQLNVPKTVLDRYVKEVASDPVRDIELGDLPGLPEVPTGTTVPLSNKAFSFSKFKAILKRKKSSSAPGPNKIPYTVYKKCPDLARYLWCIHKAVFAKIETPLCWRINDGIMIPKVEAPISSSVGDFRQIALLNVEGKVFWSLVADRLYNYLVVNNAFVSPRVQKGSIRRVAGCWEHTAMMWSALKDAKVAKKSLAVLWLDLANAYGSVPHKLIVFALRRYKVPEDWITLIMSYYDGMWGRTTASGVSSEWVLYERGIFAGCTISVVLFIAAFNVLLEYVDAADVKRYEMSAGSRIELLRGFMDDVSILTSSISMTRIALKRMEDAVKWARMRLKPEKSRSLVIEDGQVVDTEPFTVGGELVDGDVVGGEGIPALQRKPLRTLGRVYNADISDKWYQKELEKKVASRLKRLDRSKAKGAMKLWALHHILLPQVRWDLMVYDLPISFVEGLEQTLNRYIRKWLGVSRTLTDVALYAKGSPCPLPFMSLVHLYKSTKVGSHMQLMESAHKEIVENVIPSSTGVKWRLRHRKKCSLGKESSLEVDDGAIRVIEQRLESRSVSGKVAQGRMGVEFSGGKDGKPAESRSIRQQYCDVVAEETEEVYFKKAVGQALQGSWSNWKSYTQRSLTWRSLVYGDVKLTRFCIGATYGTLANPSNLKRWGFEDSGQCTLCGKDACTIPHVLSGCSIALGQGRFRYRHDNVLRVLCHHICGFINGRNNGCRTRGSRVEGTGPSPAPIQFVRAGVKLPRSALQTRPPPAKAGVLGSDVDWVVMSDLDNRLVFPDHIVQTKLRPDLVIYSNSSSTVIMIELTCPSEENFEKRHEEKLNRYTDLQADCESAGWKVHLYAVEVGARGYTAQSLSSCLRALGLKNRPLRKCLEDVGNEALRTSFHVWMWRDSATWCKVGFPEKGASKRQGLGLGSEGRVVGLVVGEADGVDGIQVGVGDVEAHEIVMERGNEDVVDQEQDYLAGDFEQIPVQATVETGSPSLPTHEPTQSEQIPVQATVETDSPSLPTDEPAQSEQIPVQSTVETGSPTLSTQESTHEPTQSPYSCKSAPARPVKQQKTARSAESARTVKPTGIRNMGHTCYLNSILQALSVFEEYYSSCPQKPGFLKAFLDAMKLLSSGRSPPVQPVALLRQLQSEMRVTFRDFNYNTPQDVPHILSVVMEKINAESESSRQLSEISVRTVTTCSVCSFKSVKIEAQTYLNVPVCESLSEMISEFTAEQVMDGDNAYSCPQCACKQKAFRSEELASAPLILVLVLRRFVRSCRQGSLQPAFTRSRQCVNHRLPLEVSLRDDVGGEQSARFEAVTVVHHKGSLSGGDGHYFAHVKKDQRWFKCNDSIVKNSVHRNIGSETAYVIFCKRI